MVLNGKGNFIFGAGGGLWTVGRVVVVVGVGAQPLQSRGIVGGEMCPVCSCVFCFF